MRHIVLCGLSGCIIAFHIISWMAQFKKITDIKYVFLNFNTTFSEIFFILRRIAWGFDSKRILICINPYPANVENMVSS
jgi:hypothetical protein